jgi:predicted phage tail protein
MQTAILEGKIGEKFGREWPIDGCNSLKDTFKLIDCQTEGLIPYLIEASENNIDFSIQRGIDFIGEEELLLSIGNEDLIITEIPAGQKSGGAKILAAILIAVVVIYSGGTAGVGMFGTGAETTWTAAGGIQFTAGGLNKLGVMAMTVASNLAMSGITQLLTKGPEMDKAEENKGYLFNGPVNTTQQGLPVPVAYGELVVGGAVISQSFNATEWPEMEWSVYYTADTYVGDIGLATHNTTAYAGSYGSGELYSTYVTGT